MNLHSHETPEEELPPVINLDEERRRRKEIADEVEHEHEIATAVADHPEDVDMEELKIEALRRLESAQNAKERVNVIATILDTYGADALLGLIFPEIGDVAVSGTVLAYLIGESIMAGVPASDVAKMAWYQLVDAAIGSIPGLGDIGDHFYKATLKSATLFAENRDRLIAEALEAGVSEEAIGEILTAHSELESAAIGATKLSGKVFKAAA